MIKQFCITTLFVFISVFSFAQDIIETIDAKRIEAKILEVSETEIKYKEIDNIEGPTFILSTNKIRSITYANGIVISSPNVNPELVQFAKENKRHVIDYMTDRTEFYTKINKLYDTLCGSAINN